MSNPTAAMLVIGDEILSGRTRDSNTNYLAKALTDVGIDQPAIVAAVKALSDAYDHVFTSGGIGPTHDDITADAIGAAFGAHVGVRDDARALLQAHYDRAGTTLNEARLRMARIPDGAALIDNPVSTAPGFTIKNVNVMAGVPSVFEAMVASVISKLAHGAPLLSENWRIMRGEGDVAAPLAQIAADHPDLSLGSYPFQKDGAYGTNIVIRGTDQTRVAAAMAQLQALFPA